MTNRPITKGAVRRAVAFAEPFLAVIALALLLEIVGRTGMVDPDRIPPTSRILDTLATDLQGETLQAAVWETFWTWMVGMVLATIVAVPTGILLGYSRILDASTFLTREFFRSVPTVTAIPFLILLFGVTPKLIIVLVVFSAAWPLVIQTVAGLEDIDPVTRDTARIYGLGPLAQFTKVVFPSALPQILTGFRLATGLGLAVSVAASIFAGGSGIGAAINSAANSGRADLMYGRILLIGLIAMCVSLALSRIERRALHWHPSTRESLA